MQRPQVWYPIFATFQKGGHFCIQIKLASKQLVTESFFPFENNSQYFRETLNQLSSSCLPANRCYSPSNTTGFGHFGQETAPSDPFVQRLLWKNKTGQNTDWTGLAARKYPCIELTAETNLFEFQRNS